MAESLHGQGSLDLYASPEGTTPCDLCGEPVPVGEDTLFLVGLDGHGRGGRFVGVCCLPEEQREIDEARA